MSADRPTNPAQGGGAKLLPSRRRPPGWAVVAVLVLVDPLLFGANHLPVLIPAGVSALAAVGLGVVTGRGGQVSLGQFALVGVGAYAAGYSVAEWGMSAGLSVLIGVAAAVLVALLASPILRLSGLYLALATLALAIIFERLLVAASSITGGTDGLPVPGPLEAFGFGLTTEEDFYYVVWGSVVIALVITGNLLKSRFGRALDAIREDEAMARSAGVRVTVTKMGAWLFSAACAGLAGVFYAYYNQFLTPEQFTLGPSIIIVAAVVVGGPTKVSGPVFGVLLIAALPDMLGLGSRVEALLPPLLLVLFAGFLSGGVAQAPERLARWWRSRSSAEPVGAA